MQPDYGIDAPGVRRGMLDFGLGGIVLAGGALTVARGTSGLLSTVAAVIATMAVISAVYGLGMAAYMTYVSRVVKLRTRERLLDHAQAVTTWTGRETVLDVGCGRGLMMIGAAQRLTTGKAVGVDVWRNEDQADNAPQATLENARREGVAERVSVENGDARALPFGDATFDAVLSHWVVHNLPHAADRSLALDEMMRVLRPGGVLVLADIAHQADYWKHLATRGMTDLREVGVGFPSRFIAMLSGGSFRPRAIIGLRSATTCRPSP